MFKFKTATFANLGPETIEYQRSSSLLKPIFFIDQQSYLNHDEIMQPQFTKKYQSDVGNDCLLTIFQKQRKYWVA